MVTILAVWLGFSCLAQEVIEAIDDEATQEDAALRDYVGDMYVFQEAGIEIPILDNWTYRTSEGTLRVEDPDKKITLLFLTSELQMLDRETEVLAEEISQVISHPEVASVENGVEVNGLLHYTAKGYGLFGDEIVDWNLTFVAGARKSVMAIRLGEVTTQSDALEKLFSHIYLQRIEELLQEEDDETEDSPIDMESP